MVVRALLRSGLRPESDDQRVLSYAAQWGAKMMSPAAAQEQRPPNAITNASSNANAIASSNAIASPAHSSASSSATQVGHPHHALGAPLPLGAWPRSPDASLCDSYEAKCST